MNRLKFTLVALTVCGFSSLANAADLPRRMPAKVAPAPVYAPVFTWTGFYAGVNAGWGWSRGDGDITIGGATGPTSGSGNGFLGGAQIGYNWQINSLVLGVETDFQGSSGSGDVTGTAGATNFTATGKTPWFGTIRGRLGYAMDRWMIYATGGAVYGKSTLEGTVNTTGAFSSSATYWTWTAGGGVEWAVWDRWSVKAEYLYVGKPDEVPTPPGTTALSGNAHADIVRVGLNYHF